LTDVFAVHLRQPRVWHGSILHGIFYDAQVNIYGHDLAQPLTEALQSLTEHRVARSKSLFTNPCTLSEAPTEPNTLRSETLLPHLVQQRLKRLQNILSQILHLLNTHTKPQQSLINSRIAHPAPLDQTLHATETSRMMPQLEFTR